MAKAKKTTKSKAKEKKAKGSGVNRYICRMCGYVYSPLRGEPHNGIPAGTEFDDLPDTYVCPVCGYTAEREPPGICPVCGAKGEMFKKIE